MPSTWNGTTSGSSVSGPKVATIEWSGRTQVRRPSPPAHRLRPGKGADYDGKNLRQQLERGPAGLLDQREVEVALFRVLLDGGLVN